MGQTGSVTLEAVFYDQASHTTVRPFTVTLACTNYLAANIAACSGHCTELNDTTYCGGCGNNCSTWATSHSLYSPECNNSACRGELQSDVARSCDNLCGGAGLTCESRAWLPDGNIGGGQAYYWGYLTAGGGYENELPCWWPVDGVRVRPFLERVQWVWWHHIPGRGRRRQHRGE